MSSGTRKLLKVLGAGGVIIALWMIVKTLVSLISEEKIQEE